MRARRCPAERGAERDSAIELVHVDHTLQDQSDTLPPHRGGNPSHHVARDRLLEQDGHAAEGTEVLLRAHHRRRAGTRRRHDFDERDQLGRVQRVRHEAAILAAAACSSPWALASNTVTAQPAEAHSAAQPQPMSPAPITATLRGIVVTRPPPETRSASPSGAPPSGTHAPTGGDAPLPRPPAWPLAPAHRADRSACGLGAAPPPDPLPAAAPRSRGPRA